MAITHEHTFVPQFTQFLDPSDTPNFTMNWAAFLNDVNTGIDNSSWTISPTLTVVNDYVDGQQTTVILSGLAEDVTYQVTNTIVTDDTDPLTFERSFKFKAKQL